MSAAAESKAGARAQLQLRLRAMTDAERAEASEQIRRTLAQQPFWRDARSILGFVPARNEPNLWPALQLARAAGQRIYLPRFNADDDRYIPCLVDNLDNLDDLNDFN